MKILFYLPSATPWWLDNLIGPLIKHLKQYFSISVIVPYFHNGTGLIKDHCSALTDNPDVDWHFIDQNLHPKLRIIGNNSEEIIRLARSIDADFTLCRTADMSTPQFFPGQVSYIMEVGFPPLRYPFACTISAEPIFTIGRIPHFSKSTAEEILSELEQPWLDMKNNFKKINNSLSRNEYLKRFDVPLDKIIIAVPLEYEHVENDFSQHRIYRDNISILRFLVDRFDERFFFVATNHPLNFQYSDQSHVQDFVNLRSDRIAMLTPPETAIGATDILFNYCDAVIVENSKSIFSALFLSKPILRLSNCPSAPITNIYHDIEVFISDLSRDKAKFARQEDVQLMFAYQVANCMIAINAISWTHEESLSWLRYSFNPQRWKKNSEIYKRMRTQEIDVNLVIKQYIDRH